VLNITIFDIIIVISFGWCFHTFHAKLEQDKKKH